MNGLEINDSETAMATETPTQPEKTQAEQHPLRFDGLPYAGDHLDRVKGDRVKGDRVKSDRGDGGPGKNDRDIVIFDGDCKFCLKGVRQLKRLDLGGKRLAYVSLHDPLVAQKYPELSHDDMMNQMYVADHSGGLHGGAKAGSLSFAPFADVVACLLHFYTCRLHCRFGKLVIVGSLTDAISLLAKTASRIVKAVAACTFAISRNSAPPLVLA